MGFEVPVWPRNVIYCIFIVWMSSSEKRGGTIRGEIELLEDLAQAAVDRDPHQAKWNGAGQAEPDFFQ